jgi:hypothetical protein
MAKLPANFTDTANQRFKEANRFWANWIGGARDDYAFVSGAQWLDEDEAILKEQKRPPITFNYSEKMIDAVVGAEVSNRQEVVYKPRELTDAPLAELWTNAAKWVRDEGNIEDEETDAFRDCLICGMGWTHTRMNYDTEADGMIDTGRVDPTEMRADPSATKPGLTDRRYSFRLQWVDERLAKRYWPQSVAFSTIPENSTGIDTITRGHRYEGDESDDPDMHKGQVQIRHYECVELEPFYRVANESGIQDVSNEDFAVLKEALDAAGITYVKQWKRVYYYAYFANETLLEGDKSPCQVGFTYQCITGKRDRNKNTWYGLTRVMKDPQRWANKWLSQILHIINSNAKGGLLAEVGAFVDPQRAQDEWAMPESITLLKEGGLQKIEQKQVVNYPTGLDRLMEFALASLPQVTGINLEALGLAAREQANVLEQSRKQAAYGLLAPVFDSLRRYRKNHGRILLDFIHNYISDGRLIRIGGPDSQQFIPLTKAPKAPRYDIIVDQSPHSPDSKQKTWEILEAILPNMMKAGLPIPPDLLDYTPLPSAMVLKWKQFIQQTGGVTPEQMAKLQEELQKMQEENQNLQLKLKDKSAELMLKARESQQDMALQREAAMHKLRIAYIELEQKLLLARAEFQLEHAESEATIAIAQDKQKAEARQAHESAILDAMAKITTALAKLEAEAEADKNDPTKKD